jgi:hypothetical protein
VSPAIELEDNAATARGDARSIGVVAASLGCAVEVASEVAYRRTEGSREEGQLAF